MYDDFPQFDVLARYKPGQMTKEELTPFLTEFLNRVGVETNNKNFALTPYNDDENLGFNFSAVTLRIDYYDETQFQLRFNLQRFLSNCGICIISDLSIKRRHPTYGIMGTTDINDYIVFFKLLENLLYSYNFSVLMYTTLSTSRYNLMNETFSQLNWTRTGEFLNPRSGNTNYIWQKYIRS